MSGWMDVVKLFSYHYSSYSFCLILTKVGIRVLCANTKKTLEQIFEILFKKFLANV